MHRASIILTVTPRTERKEKHRQMGRKKNCVLRRLENLHKRRSKTNARHSKSLMFARYFRVSLKFFKAGQPERDPKPESWSSNLAFTGTGNPREQYWSSSCQFRVKAGQRSRKRLRLKKHRGACRLGDVYEILQLGRVDAGGPGNVSFLEVASIPRIGSRLWHFVTVQPKSKARVSRYSKGATIHKSFRQQQRIKKQIKEDIEWNRKQGGGDIRRLFLNIQALAYSSFRRPCPFFPLVTWCRQVSRTELRLWLMCERWEKMQRRV